EQTTGTGMWQVLSGRWHPSKALDARIAASLDLGDDLTVWRAGVDVTPDVPIREARLWLGGELLEPHTWPGDSGLPADDLAWHDADPRHVVSWDERRHRVSVVSTDRPGSLRVEYPLDPSRELARFDVRRPTDLAELIQRATFGRVERRAVRLPASGGLEWTLQDVAATTLELQVAVGGDGWTVRNGFLARAPNRGDGVTFAVDVVHAGSTTRAWSRDLGVGEGWHEAEVDLAPWAGRDITLRLVSDPGPQGDHSFDEAFWAGLRLRGGNVAAPDRPHIVLIDIDTLRADRLGCAGYARDTTPRLDRWVEDTGATVFTDCVATSSWTLPSTMSLLTGLHVFQHGVDSAARALAGTVPTLAELLRSAGYETAAWVEGGYVSARHGFGRGFESYDATTERDPDWSDVLDWMSDRRSEQPCFVFLQTYLVHAPYPHDDRFWTPTPGEDIPLGGSGVTAGTVFLPYRQGALDLDAAERDYIDRLYDAGVRRMDDLLGAFLEDLDERFGREGLMVVITSDHGEELFDHDGLDHGQTLYEEVLQVPLIVRWPGPATPSPDIPRTTLDIAPTLLREAGVPLPDDWPGRALHDEPDPSRLRTAQLGEWGVALRSGAVKLIDMTPSGAAATPRDVQLFDLSADSKEQRDLSGTRPETVAELLEIWETYRRQRRSRSAAASASPMDPDTMRALQELGYVEDR
ncbi:MAG: sulfatase, partial [Planctomycetota bacterium]